MNTGSNIVKKRKISKFSLMIKSMKILKNWRDLISIYCNQKNNMYSVLETRKGIKIKIRNNSTDIQAFANVWLLEEYNQRGFIPQDNGSVLDIGSHIGLYAMYISQKSPKTKIFCFEPVKDNFNLLKENISNNLLENVRICNSAVSNRVEKGEIFLSEDQSAHSLVQKSGRREKIDTTTLENIIDENHIERISVLKLDCEGSEYDIIDSLSDEILKKIENICLEYHLKSNTDARFESLKNKLMEHKFQLEILPTYEKLGMIFAKK